MRIKILLLLMLLAQVAVSQTLETVTDDPDGAGPFPAAERVKGRLVLEFHGTPSQEEMRLWGQFYGISPSSVPSSDSLATVTVDDSNLSSILARLSQDPLLANVSPDYVARVHGFCIESEVVTDVQIAASFPDDPLYKHQWHHKMIGAPKAWKKADGKGVTVAVLDSGIAYTAKGFVQPVEDLAQTTIVEGYDFINDDPVAVDDLGFGTHVAGTVAQSTNNTLGTAGLAHAASLMPIKVLDKEGRGTFSGISAGIRFAADNGADIILMGFGSPADSMVMEEAIEYAREKGCLLIAGTGVDGSETPTFPAAYEQVLSVGAVDRSRTVTSYSNRGVDITAPGGYAEIGKGILQNALHPKNPKRSGYLWFAGTSSAASHVAGTAALVMSSGVSDPEAVTQILLTTTKKKRDKKAYGAGVLQADKAVDKARKLASRSEDQTPCFTLAALLLFLLVGLKLQKN